MTRVTPCVLSYTCHGLESRDFRSKLTSLQDTKIVLWKGDITKLEGSNLAVVNAANEQGLGCYVPHHRCIDNVLHRHAGPRLRMACRQAMQEQRSGSLLKAGTDPIVTPAFSLPSAHVIHVTGPQIHNGMQVQSDEEDNLRKSYQLSLDVASQEGRHHPAISAIAFPCISTGLFGFPADKAADIALSTVQKWLQNHPNSPLKTIMFNVFTEKDHVLYKERFGKYFAPEQSIRAEPNAVDFRTTTVALAKQWIEDADAVLICAGAGMSVKQGEMVYTNPDDFAAAYPWFASRWTKYKTSYDCMGLEGDPFVPRDAKWALYAKHMDNMRWSFAPNEGYGSLRRLIGEKKNHFVLTSNVDASFERSGFDPNRIYTPQGEWTYVQCTRPCHSDSVYPSRPYIDAILPHISDDGRIPKELIPKCPRCGGDMFGNVRGGGWFLHHEKYEIQNARLQQWMEDLVSSNAKVAIIEVGAGFNTPTVTRFPVEAFARELGDRAFFIRVNPTEPEVPQDLRAIAFDEGLELLKDIEQSERLSDLVTIDKDIVENQVREHNEIVEKTTPIAQAMAYKRYLGHFDWRVFLGQLSDKREE